MNKISLFIMLLMMEKKDLFRRLYFNSWVRIPIKFILMFSTIKIVYDYFQYRTAFRTRRSNPRSMSFNQQCPLNPYIPVPYIYYQNYEQYMDLKRYYTLQSGLVRLQTVFSDRYYLYYDAPCRESSNGIDRLFIRAKTHSSSEKGKFYFLNQLAQKQGEVPAGVYQEIRMIREPELEVEETLVPSL